MEKEFEALKNISIRCHSKVVWDDPIDSDLDTVKQALTELQAIKEAKPSEALECVDVLKEDGCITTLYQAKALETIRQYILKTQEQEKENAEYKEVLRIIFEKSVNMSNLKVAIDNNSLRLYNNTISNAFKHLKLTQEEFDLLKRWCEKCQKRK